MKTKEIGADRVFNIINVIISVLIMVFSFYPLYFVLIASFSDPALVTSGKVWILPARITFVGYKQILAYSDLWMGYGNTILYTVIGTFINIVFTVTGAYALSRRDIPARGFFIKMFVFTMLFSGGLIPTYLLIKALGLYNNFWVMILPGALSVWNFLIAKSYFEANIPNELLEAAKIDGCSDIRFFVSVVLPISKVILAVLVIYYSVSHWNAYFNAMIYLKDRWKWPLQLVLRQILITAQNTDELTVNTADVMKALNLAESMKYGVIILASLPVMAMYPFFQKYFIKGVMIGSIKG